MKLGKKRRCVKGGKDEVWVLERGYGAKKHPLHEGGVKVVDLSLKERVTV